MMNSAVQETTAVALDPLPVVGDDDLVLDGGGDVATVGCGEVDRHGPWLHAGNHVGRNQLGCLRVRVTCRQTDTEDEKSHGKVYIQYRDNTTNAQEF